LIAFLTTAKGVVPQVPYGNYDGAKKCHDSFACFSKHVVTEYRCQDQDRQTDEAKDTNQPICLAPKFSAICD
jgi:hypothetical protein